MFNECYQLAFTQHKKNKDIPEGGAKSIIMLLPNQFLHLEMQLLRKEITCIATISYIFNCTTVDRSLNVDTNFISEASSLEYLHRSQRIFVSNLLSLVAYRST